MCDKTAGHHKLIGNKETLFFSVSKKPTSKKMEVEIRVLPISHFCEDIQTRKGTTVTALGPEVVLALIMYPFLKIEGGHRSKANRIIHSWMEKKEGGAEE